MRTPCLLRPVLEPLESRIAPATLLNSRTITYTDVDGDTVTISSSVPAFDSLANLTFTVVSGSLEHLDKLVLDADAQGAVITIKAKAGVSGDGLVNIGYIDATGVDLKSVTVGGDLGQIDAGDGNFSTPALGSLTVGSLGVFGALYGPAGLENVASNFAGGLGSVKIVHDLDGASLVATGDGVVPAKIGSVSIGGSMVGSAVSDSGKIQSDGSIGAVMVGGSIRGGAGSDSGRIRAGTSITSVNVAGSVFGDDGTSSGSIEAGTTIGTVRIGQNLEGGDGNDSGLIKAGGLPTGVGISSVTVLGGILGNDGDSSGRIESGKNIGPVVVGRDLSGGDGNRSGTISADGDVSSISIGGSIRGGDGDGSGGIKVDTKLGTTRVGGSVLGRSLGSSSTFSIAATGYIKAQNLTSLTIGGDLVAGKNNVIPAHLDLSGSLTNTSPLVTLSDTSSLRAGYKVTLGAFTSKILSVDSATQITLADAFTGTTGAGQTLTFDSPSLTQSGFVHAEETLGSVTILGDIRGSATNNAILSAAGIPAAKLVSTAKVSLALGKVTVGGSVRHALIGAGLDSDNLAVNPDAQIGAVSIGRDWVASSLVAGIAPGADGRYGTGDDSAATQGSIYTDRSTIVSKIASITIGGQVIGSSAAGDHYGFVAQSIGSLKVSGTTLKIRPSTILPASLALSPATSFDVTLKEV